MSDAILRWLRDGPRPAGIAGVPVGTPRWLRAAALPPVTLAGQRLPWRHALAIARLDPPGLVGGERLCMAVCMQWMVGRRGDLGSVGLAALEALSPEATARLILRGATATLHTAREAGARLLLSIHDRAPGPQTWAALCAIALWPRTRNFRHALRQHLAARDPDGDWRALLLANLTADLPEPFRLIGSTTTAPTGSRDALRAALMEDAMCAGHRWTPARWQERIAPHVDDLDMVLARDDAGIGVCHPAGAASLPDAPDRAFLQRQRPIFRPDEAERSRIFLRRYRDRRLPGQRIRWLLRQGWCLGEELDYPRIFDLYLPLPARGWSAHIRLFPGFPPRHRAYEPVGIFSIGFTNTLRRPRWGGYWIREHPMAAHMVEPTPGDPACFHDDLGATLGEVPPALFSEVVWTIDTLHRRYAISAG